MRFNLPVNSHIRRGVITVCLLSAGVLALPFLLFRTPSGAAPASVPQGLSDDRTIADLPVIDEHIRLGHPRSTARIEPPNVLETHQMQSGAPLPAVTSRPSPSLPAPPAIQLKPVEFPAYAVARPVLEQPRVPSHSRAAATVVLEQVNESLPRHAVNRIPLFNRIQTRQFKAGDRFIAARPVREMTPFVPPSIRSRISGIVPVELRISIDKRGAVAETELLSRKVDSALASISVRTASSWDFVPARIGNRPVSSEMLVHMRFGEAR